MKKVLILAYDFPPYVSVGGLRPFSWYKYFIEFGVYPIVVTRNWSNQHGSQLDYIAASDSFETVIEETESGTLIKTPYKPNLANRIMLKHGDSKYKFIRKGISAYYEFAQFIFNVGPKANLFSAANKYLQSNKVDAIIATGDPFVLFKYASSLAKKHNTPWIADYRDIWSHNKHTQRNFLLKKWHTYFERKIVSTSSVITTVSEFLEKKITLLVKSKPVYILPNGYDPEFIETVKNIPQQTSELNIAFVGSIYDWHPLFSFFEELTKFIKSRNETKIRINFYGINLYGVTFKGSLNEIIEREFPELKPYVFVHKKMVNKLLLQELAKQNVMLLFNYYSYMGTKIFDYLGLKRAILFCFTNDEKANELKAMYYDIEEMDGVSNSLQVDLIKDTKSGYLVKDNLELLKTLTMLYEEFENTGLIKCNTINEENYSRKNQVKQLAEIVKNIS